MRFYPSAFVNGYSYALIERTKNIQTYARRCPDGQVELLCVGTQVEQGVEQTLKVAFTISPDGARNLHEFLDE